MAHIRRPSWPSFRSSNGVLVGAYGLEHPALRDAAPPRGQDCAVGVQEHSSGLAGYSQLTPRLERGIPEHGEGGSGGLHETLGQPKVVLGAHSDESENIGIVSSKLLDTGGLPATGGSMRRPEPQHDGPVRWGEAGQVHGGPSGNVHQFDRGQIRCWGRISVLWCRLGGGCRRGCGGAGLVGCGGGGLLGGFAGPAGGRHQAQCQREP